MSSGAGVNGFNRVYGKFEGDLARMLYRKDKINNVNYRVRLNRLHAYTIHFYGMKATLTSENYSYRTFVKLKKEK